MSEQSTHMSEQMSAHMSEQMSALRQIDPPRQASHFGGIGFAAAGVSFDHAYRLVAWKCV